MATLRVGYVPCIYQHSLRPYQMRHASFFTMPICYSDIALQLAKLKQSADVKFWKQQVQATLEHIFLRLRKSSNL